MSSLRQDTTTRTQRRRRPNEYQCHSSAKDVSGAEYPTHRGISRSKRPLRHLPAQQPLETRLPRSTFRTRSTSPSMPRNSMRTLEPRRHRRPVKRDLSKRAQVRRTRRPRPVLQLRSSRRQEECSKELTKSKYLCPHQLQTRGNEDRHPTSPTYRRHPSCTSSRRGTT